MRLPPHENGILSDCTLCPRSCHVNRLKGERGFCGETATLRAARAALYFNEEPVISGSRGSGAIFFSGCCLGCIYCQNRSISRPGKAEVSSFQNSSARNIPSECVTPADIPSSDDCRILPLSPERLSEIFFELESQGAHNINLVTPEHFVPLILPALRRAKREGLSLPVVYNTGSYERVETVQALEGLVDVWLPDLKYVSSALSARHTGAADYFAYASAAIREMVRQCPEPLFSDGSHAIDCPDDTDDPLMVRGVLVRHLALPGCGEDSRAVLRYLHGTYGDRIFISILNQYTPMPQAARLAKRSGSFKSPAAGSFPAPSADHFKDSSRDVFKDKSGDVFKDSSRDVFKDKSGGVFKDNSGDVFKDRSGGVFKDKSGGVFKDNSGDVFKDNSGRGLEAHEDDLGRRLSDEEYDALVDYAIEIGIVNGFIQESGTVSPSYIPRFDGTGIV